MKAITEKYDWPILKLRLLADIRVDLEICALEGWDKKAYIRELKQLIDSIS